MGKLLNYIEHIFLLKCSKRFNSSNCSGLITLLQKVLCILGAVYISIPADSSADTFLLKVTEKSCNKTCINSQNSNWGCLLIYALSFGFDLLMNVTCHIIYSPGIFSLTTLITILSQLIWSCSFLQSGKRKSTASSQLCMILYFFWLRIQFIIQSHEWEDSVFMGLSIRLWVKCFFRAYHFRLFLVHLIVQVPFLST